jgi:hypothetical protein
LAKIEKGERQQTTSLTNNREEKYSMKKREKRLQKKISMKKKKKDDKKKYSMKKKKDDESKSDNDVDSGDPKTGKQFDDYVKKKIRNFHE